jgi:hypothetical protein
VISDERTGYPISSFKYARQIKGLGWQAVYDKEGGTTLILVLPLYVLSVLFLALPLRWGYVVWNRRRRRRGFDVMMTKGEGRARGGEEGVGSHK